MAEVIETSEDGRYRAVVIPDMDPMQPDGDFFGYVFRFDGRQVELAAKSHGMPEEDFGLAYAWEHFGDMDRVERYARMFRGAVGFDYFDTRDGKFVNVITMADLQAWGFASVGQYREQTGNADPSHGCLDEWRAYVEGDVYFFAIEKRVTWTPDDPDFETREGWETVESIGGFYGYKYAEETAREELAAVVSTGVTA